MSNGIYDPVYELEAEIVPLLGFEISFGYPSRSWNLKVEVETLVMFEQSSRMILLSVGVGVYKTDLQLRCSTASLMPLALVVLRCELPVLFGLLALKYPSGKDAQCQDNPYSPKPPGISLWYGIL